MVRGTVYCIGWGNGSDTLRALDPKTGQTIWEQSYPSPQYGRRAVGDQAFFRGATPTPEFDPASGPYPV